MLPILIVAIIAAALAIGAYQLVIQKYYWGPKGPPKKSAPAKDSRRRRS